MAASRGGGRNGHHPALLIPSHLLEITIISAQDLKKWSQSVNAYAAAWVHPDEKLYTQVDRAGRTDPTWNDKFVFRIDNAFLRSDTSAVTVTIYATRSCLNPRKDPILGIARILLSASLGPSPANAGSRRVVALQVRRPRSLRPQGILNVAVALLDSYSHSMPLYYGISPPAAFALKDLMKRPKSMTWETMDERSEPGILDRSGPLERTRSLERKERKELENKLEKWKTELSPEMDGVERSQGRRKRKKRRGGEERQRWCFCGGRE